MTHPALYLICVFAALFVITLGLILWARAKKWRPTPIHPVWAVLAIVAADVLAGLVCSYFANDIRVLYGWLIALPVAAVLFPLIIVGTSLCVRLIMRALHAAVSRFRQRK